MCRLIQYVWKGISRDATGDDPNLGNKRNELITAAAQKLADAGMIIFDRPSGDLTITDLGRIAAKYYIRYASIEIFNKEFRPRMSEADVLAMLSMSTEVRCLIFPRRYLLDAVQSLTKYKSGSLRSKNSSN
jgi:antiviral helicase SLH1